MLTYRVNDMTCGHCVATISKAVKNADPKASIEVDLPQHLVRVDTDVEAGEIEQAIREAGYSPAAC